MQTVLLDLQKEIKKTILFITHDLDEALRLGDQIAILRDGEVIQQGTSQDIVLRPADAYVANFVKEVNRGRVVHVEAVMKPAPPGTPVTGAWVPAGASIEEAIRKLAGAPDLEVAVVGPDGQALGLVDLRLLASAMVSPQGAASPAEAPQRAREVGVRARRGRARGAVGRDRAKCSVGRVRHRSLARVDEGADRLVLGGVERRRLVVLRASPSTARWRA